MTRSSCPPGKGAHPSLIWCVGVRADPLVGGLDLETNRGRLVVDEFMAVPGAPDIYACGDCAAVPDLTRPGQVCGMTAQHAQRQGKLVARNVAASLGHGTRQAVQAPDLGFLWTWAGWPPPPTRWASRCRASRQRRHPRLPPGRHVRKPDAGLTDWTLNAVTPPEATSLGVITPHPSRSTSTSHTPEPLDQTGHTWRRKRDISARQASFVKLALPPVDNTGSYPQAARSRLARSTGRAARWPHRPTLAAGDDTPRTPQVPQAPPDPQDVHDWPSPRSRKGAMTGSRTWWSGQAHPRPCTRTPASGGLRSFIVLCSSMPKLRSPDA